MRRFYCSKCNKMKRVQQWPRIIDNVTSPLPEERIGECNRHSGGFYLNAVNEPRKVTNARKQKKAS